MTTVTGMTAAAMQAIRDGSIVSAAFDSANHLILTKYDGTTVDGGALGTATTTLAGPVELATNAETQSGSATNLAVTPAGLASLSGYRVQILADNAVSETADPTAYSLGTTLMSAATGSGWSINGGLGTVVTEKIGITRTVQTFYESSGGTVPTKAWIREYNNSVGGGGWTTWAQMMLTVSLISASFTQTTSLSNYPQGQSRLYFTTANSSGWDFTGFAGEVITFVSGTDFARQTFTKHVGGTAVNTEQWIRTATSAGGWTNWLVVAEDTGWQNLSITGVGYTAVQQIACRRRNGIVFCKGHFQAPNGGFTTCATLPSGMRPSTDRLFPVTSNTGTNMSVQVLASTGAVQTYTAASTTAWFSLASISFPIG